MDIEHDPGFWIPPEEKKDQPGIPAQLPIPDQTPPPDFNPDKGNPDMEDHPREDAERSIHPHVPQTDEEQELPRGAVIIGPDGDEETDDDIYNPFKSDDDL